MHLATPYRRLLLLGGTGFIGRHLAAEFAAREQALRVAVRRRDRAKALWMLPMVECLQADVHDDTSLARVMEGCDAVINLVGILHDQPGQHPWGPAFERAHVALAARIVRACKQAGVSRLLHMSALGVTEDGAETAPSMYLRSKARAEQIVRESGLAWTVFRPSVVFGEGDHITGLFGDMQRWAPVLLLPGADAQLQPVYVGDVVQAYANALVDDRTVGRVFELAGADVLSMRELVRLCGEAAGHARPILGLPDGAARMLARLLEKLPSPPLTRDNLASLTVPNVASGPMDPLLGIPTPRGVRSWLADKRASR